MCDILLIEAFYDGSHRSLIDLLHENLSPRSMLITLPGTKWPWRARCSSLVLSDLIPENANTYKYLFSSSIINLSELISLRLDLRSLKTIIYFHENDLAYPKQNENQEQRDFQFGYNQILTALVADICLFNSYYNLNTFLDKLGPFLNRIPSPKPNIQQIRKTIENKSKIFYYPLNKPLTSLLKTNPDKTGPLCIIWPHRWEHDKDPETFFSVILELHEIHSLKFSLIILGQSYGEAPSIFSEILTKLPSDYIRHWGFAPSKTEYEQLLSEGDVVVSTAQHEFFGVAMLEACRAGCIPLVPDRLAYTELYPNEQHRYRTRTQLLNKLKEYSQKLDYVRTKAPKQDTFQFEWDKNENIRQQYLQLFQNK